MKTREHRDSRVIPFPTRENRNVKATPQHRYTCGGLVVVCPKSRELVTWSRLCDPTSWDVVAENG